MWWVSRKEFEELKLYKHDIDGLWALTKRFEQRIAELEAANNCRDGKHEWQGYIDMSTNTSHMPCKHCGVKKDELDDNQTDEWRKPKSLKVKWTKQQLKELKGFIKPKSKKGKK